jgi:hypothetical protein
MAESMNREISLRRSLGGPIYGKTCLAFEVALCQCSDECTHVLVPCVCLGYGIWETLLGLTTGA